MTKTYYLPPKGDARVWMSFEYDGSDKVVLEDGGVRAESPTPGEVQKFRDRQEALYRKMYPKLCL